MHIPVVVVYEHGNICPFMRSFSDGVDASSEMPVVDVLQGHGQSQKDQKVKMNLGSMALEPILPCPAPCDSGWARAAALALSPPCIALWTFRHKGSLGIAKHLLAVGGA